MSEQLWTFGVELEFLLGEAMPGTKVTDGHTRVVHFPPTELSREEHDDEVLASKNNISFEIESTWVNATAHVLRTLREAGFDAQRDGSEEPDITQWQLKTDCSLNIDHDNPLYEHYTWYPIELVSPAFWNHPASYQEVERVCELLNSTYLVMTNKSTGLHVHVGTGTKDGPSFDLLKKTAAFFYAFEPQLAMLHPKNRQGVHYAKRIRDSSRFAMKRKGQYGGPPPIARGISHFLNAKNIDNLIRDIGYPIYPKGMAYNHHSLRRKPLDVYDTTSIFPPKPTLEFRQHEGTLEPIRVLHWIQTCVGIMDYCHRVTPMNFYSLLSLAVENEKWDLLADGVDDEREEEFGPLLAESTLNPCDLLNHMGLHASADFYRNRLHKLKRNNKGPKTFPKIDWEYQELKSNLTGPLLLHTVLARKSFDIRRMVFRAERHAGRFENACFDPKSAVWPGHNESLDDDADTDASTVHSDSESEDSETDDEETSSVYSESGSQDSETDDEETSSVYSESGSQEPEIDGKEISSQTSDLNSSDRSETEKETPQKIPA